MIHPPRIWAACTYFTVQEKIDFDQRYSEGYSLPDDRYEAWLKVNHPEQFKPGNDKFHSAILAVSAYVFRGQWKMISWGLMRHRIVLLPDDRYEAWLKVNHPEQFRPGNDKFHCAILAVGAYVFRGQWKMISWGLMRHRIVLLHLL